MNRNGHIIWSQFIFILILIILHNYTTIDLLLANIWSIGFFIFGVIAPDIDHHKVQEKMHIKFLGRFTKHRGHFHSIGGMIIYGVFIFGIVYFLVELWYYPLIFGMIGYFSHLFEDQIMKIIKGSQASSTIKIW